MRKVFLGLIIAMFLISTSSFQTRTYAESAAITFTDISGHWAAKTVEIAVEKGYVAGYPDSTFKPEGQVTRAELLKMVVTALGIVEGPKIEGSQWYENYVNAAFAEGIYKNDFTGDINLPITRQELALLAIRSTNSDIRNQTDFDTSRIMYEATKAGIIQGLGKGELGVEKSTTRAQAVAIIERILKIKNRETLPVDKYAVNLAEVLWHHTNIFSVMPEVFDKEKNGKKSIDSWDKNKMFVETNNGIYKAILDSVIAVDLADKNDPNWNLVPKNLKWYDWPNAYDVRKYADAYLLLPISHLVYNNDRNIYRTDEMVFEFFGSYPPINTSLFPKEHLLSVQSLTLDGTHFYEGFIIPKDTKSFKGQIGINIYTGAMAPHDLGIKNLLRIDI